MKKILLVFVSLFLMLSFTSEVHPYHVGSVEFNYKSKSRTFEITGKFFLDDVENAVSKIIAEVEAKFGAKLRN